MGLLMLSSCSDILDEQPRTDFDPSFFGTEQGIESGLTALYAHLRDTYGYAYYYCICETGTDEYTYGHDADGNFKDADLSGVGQLNAQTSRSDALWGNAFTYINTASGIIENGTAAGTSESLISEARFFRAYDYLRLVQTFGGVPLDFGAGELKFNTSPTRYSVRNTVPEVYTKAVFPDLKIAVENLGSEPRDGLIGGLTKNAARLVLAKAYLAYGWWLQNPKNIPTYPECDRTDPDGHDAQWYFQEAYNLAVAGIKDPGPFALQPTYYDVHVGSNDRNNEVMLYADHTENSEEFNGGSLSYGSGAAPDNFAVWMVTWNYPNMTAKRADTGASFTPVLRAATQDLGRPWTRMAPPQEVFYNTFKDKTRDSRFDGTFTTVFRSNWNLDEANYSGLTAAINANDMQVPVGGAILSFVDDDVVPADAQVTTENAVGGFEVPGRSDYVVPIRAISRLKYPMLWKLGVYRTDNAGTVGQPNAGSTRPFNILYFSDFYFVAAEAAVKGAQTETGYTARECINVIRARAGKWRFSNAQNQEYIADFSAQLTAETPDLDNMVEEDAINYILDELSREYFGETRRWADLARTQTWHERAKEYTICGMEANDVTPVTYQREIPLDYYLRPIPQGQLDAMEMTAEERMNFQNPGYRY